MLSLLMLNLLMLSLLMLRLLMVSLLWLTYEISVGLVGAAVVDDEAVDAQDAEDPVNLFVREIVSKPTRLSQEVDQRLASAS